MDAAPTAASSSDASAACDSAAAPSSASPTAAAELLSSLQARYFSAHPVRLCEHPLKGRFMVAREGMRQGRVLFQARAYCKGVHESFKKRVCHTCLQYNHAGRFERTCAGCHAVFFCSDQCKDRAMGVGVGDSAAASISAAAAAPLPPAELHSLECALLRKLSSCKLDKARVGVVRMLLSAYVKAEAERQQEAKAAQQLAIPLDAVPEGSLDASLASLSLTSPAPVAVVSPEGDLLHASSLPPVYSPSFRDLAHLIGHAPSSGVQTVHQLDTQELRRYLCKLAASCRPPEPAIDVDALMELLAKVESNAFGLYARKNPGKDIPGAGTEGVDAADVAPDTSATINAASAEEPASASSVSAAAAASSAACPSSTVPPPKYVGVLLYPLASFFNHSCSPNVRVLQQRDTLTLYAGRDVAEGEELCITYCDDDQPVQARRSQLLDLYRFECDCTRCASELVAAETGTTKVGNAFAARARPTYAAPETRHRGGGKARPPKRKTIVAKIPQPEDSLPAGGE